MKSLGRDDLGYMALRTMTWVWCFGVEKCFWQYVGIAIEGLCLVV